jgi:hypothetical protein
LKIGEFEMTSLNNKMISIEVKFWTNDLPLKNVWTSGAIYLKANHRHDVSPLPQTIKFNTIEEIPELIYKALDDAGIGINASRGTTRMIQEAA